MKANSVLVLVVICTSFFLFISCAGEQPNNAELIKGTWKGQLSYILGVESKKYSPLLKDSIVAVADSVCTIKDVTVDFSNDKVQFFGVKNTVLPKYFYHWEEDKLIFSKTTSGEELDSLRNPEGTIFRLSKDSLVMNIRVYGGFQIDRVLKLKRMVK